MNEMDSAGVGIVGKSKLLDFPTIPTIVLSPLGGILADRANRRNIMVACQTGLPIKYAVYFKRTNE